MTLQYRKRDRACPHASWRVPALLEFAHAAWAQRRRARNDMRPDDRQRRGAWRLPGPHRRMRQQGSGPTDRADRMPGAEARHRRAVRQGRGSGRPRPTGRAHSGDRRRRAACGHAFAATRSADHAARRTGTIVGRACAARRRAGRRAPQPRHRADRSARHRQIGAAALRGPRPARCRSTRWRKNRRSPSRRSAASANCAPAAMRTRRSTRRPPSWPTSTRSGLRSATTGSISGAVRTEPASRRNICAGIRSMCAASSSTAPRRPRCGSASISGCRATRRSTRSSPHARQVRRADRRIPTSTRRWRAFAPSSPARAPSPWPIRAPARSGCSSRRSTRSSARCRDWSMRRSRRALFLPCSRAPKPATTRR